MAENEIRIPITVELMTGSNSGTIPGSRKSFNQGSGNVTNNIFGALSAGFLIESGKKFLSAFGQNQALNVFGYAAKYTMLGIRAASLDPTAIATIAVDAATKIVTEYIAHEKEQAKQANATDIARMKAGIFLYDANTVISTNAFGRYTYKNKR
jgi:hypothetical protein